MRPQHPPQLPPQASLRRDPPAFARSILDRMVKYEAFIFPMEVWSIFRLTSAAGYARPFERVSESKFQAFAPVWTGKP